MKSILIAPNAFKECAGQIEISSIIRANFPEHEYRSTSIPLTDGGDGFLDVCTDEFNLSRMTFSIPAPDNNSIIETEIGINESEAEAYIESAKVLGLKVIPVQLRHPMILNSKGLGSLLNQIISKYKHLQKIIIGVGGTGTNDLGLGAASIFGLRLFNEHKHELEAYPGNFTAVKEIEWEHRNLQLKIESVADIDTPLLGEYGSTRSFAKQKGATDSDIEVMEEGFYNVCKVLKLKGLLNASIKLNGAGGGLAAGLQIFLKSEIKYSHDFILTDLGIGPEIGKYDVVITGEGSFDYQSLMNKASGVLIESFKDTGAQIFIICGKTEDSVKSRIPGNVHIIEISKYFNSAAESIIGYRTGINSACEEIKKIIS